MSAETLEARAERLQGEVRTLQRRLEEQAQALKDRTEAEADYQRRQAADISAWREAHRVEVSELRVQLADLQAKLQAGTGVKELQAEYESMQAGLLTWVQAAEAELRAAKLLKPKAEIAKLPTAEILQLLSAWLENRLAELATKKARVEALTSEKQALNLRLEEAARDRSSAENRARDSEQERKRAVEEATARATEALGRVRTLTETLDQERTSRVGLQGQITELQAAAKRASREHADALRALQQQLQTAKDEAASAERGLHRANELLADDTRQAKRVPGLLIDLGRAQDSVRALGEQLEAKQRELAGMADQLKAAEARLSSAADGLTAAQFELTELRRVSTDAAAQRATELPYEGELRTLLSGGAKTAAALSAAIETWGKDPWAYARAGQTLMVLQDGPKLLDVCFAAIDAAYEIQQQRRQQSGPPLTAEQQALLGLIDPLVNFLVYAIRESSHHAGFFLRLGEQTRRWLVNSLDETTGEYLVGITLGDQSTRPLVHSELVRRVLPTLPAPTRAVLIVGAADSQQRARIFFSPPAIKQGVDALDSLLRTQSLRAPDDRDPQFLRARRALLAGEWGNTEVVAAARAALDVFYYLPESVCRELVLGVTKDQAAIESAIRDFGYDPLQALMFLDTRRQHVVDGLGRDITHIAPFMAIADLRDPRASSKALDTIRELLQQVGASFGDVTGRRSVSGHVRSQFDLALSRMLQG